MKVSIVQSVYFGDTLEGVKRSVDSILDQTSAFLMDLEYLIAVDGPVAKNLMSYLKELETSHEADFKLFYLPQNLGLAAAMNFLLPHTGGEFIFRMDSDDTCVNTRFATQITYMNDNGLDVCGSSILYQTKHGDFSVVKDALFNEAPKYYPTEMPFNHATICVRKSFYLKGGFKYEERLAGSRAFEDLYLWSRFFQFGGRFGNCTEALYLVPLNEEALYRRAKLRLVFNLFIEKFIVSRRLNRSLFSSALHAISSFRRLSFYVLPFSMIVRFYHLKK